MKSGQRVPGKENSKCKGPVGLGKQGGPCDCGEESCEGVGVDQQGREGAKEGGPHWLGETVRLDAYRKEANQWGGPGFCLSFPRGPWPKEAESPFIP